MARHIKPGRAEERGFAYMWALIALLICGILLAQVGESWATHRQREKEAELLRIGTAYRKAITLYNLSTPTGQPHFPGRLADLTKDPRVPFTRRHLRQIYLDPFTDTADWGLVPGPEGGIMGVFSQSEDAPYQQDGFAASDADFAGKAMYKDWKFVYKANIQGNNETTSSTPIQTPPTTP